MYTMRRCRAHIRAVQVCLLLAMTATVTSNVCAAPPLNPLPQPLYSFDAGSPTVNQMADGVSSGAILTVESPGDTPGERIRADGLGLNDPDDDLDGLSFNRANVTMADTFVLMFSVDRQTTGNAAADATLAGAGVPFNVTDQASRGHAAGDGFVTLTLFNRSGPVPTLRGAPTGNYQALNNADEGGNDFKALPNTSSTSTTTDPQDHVNGMSSETTPPQLRGNTGPGPTYYTVSSASPSLQQGLIPGNSGADVFFVQNPSAVPPEPVERFASADQLGLGFLDDISALVVIDEDSNGVFDGSDQVLFSLSPGSPSLDTMSGLEGVSENGGADIFTVSAGTAPALFTSAAELGLEGANDNIAGLSVVFSSDALQTALDAGIRSSSTSPVPTVGQWGLINLALLMVLSGAIILRRQPQTALAGDANADAHRSVPIDVRRLISALAVALSAGVVILIAVSTVAGPPAVRDIIGTLLAATLIGAVVNLGWLDRTG